MKCKICNHTMKKTSDFTYEEIKSFLESPSEFYVLVHLTKKNEIYDTIYIKKSLQFRKVKEIHGNKVKLYGIKNPLIDGEMIIERESQTITYKALEITPEIINIIDEYMKTQTVETYSNTKLNNFLWKKSPLKGLCKTERITINIERPVIEPSNNDNYDDDDFLF